MWPWLSFLIFYSSCKFWELTLTQTFKNIYSFYAFSGDYFIWISVRSNRALYFSADPTWGGFFPLVCWFVIPWVHICCRFNGKPRKAWNGDGRYRNHFICFCQLPPRNSQPKANLCYFLMLGFPEIKPNLHERSSGIPNSWGRR